MSQAEESARRILQHEIPQIGHKWHDKAKKVREHFAKPFLFNNFALCPLHLRLHTKAVVRGQKILIAKCKKRFGNRNLEFCPAIRSASRRPRLYLIAPILLFAIVSVRFRG